MNWTGKVKQLCFTPDVDISDDVDHLDFHSPDTYELMLPMLILKFSKKGFSSRREISSKKVLTFRK